MNFKGDNLFKEDQMNLKMFFEGGQERRYDALCSPASHGVEENGQGGAAHLACLLLPHQKDEDEPKLVDIDGLPFLEFTKLS